MIEEFAPAKINLALHVTGRRADGYHELDSLVAFASAGDVVRVERADAFSLELTGPFAAGLPVGDGNLALRAARLAARRWPEHFGPVRIRLEKNLPVASGIGGGSADAAAVLRAMTRLFGETPPQDGMSKLALELGADVPVCLAGRACRMRGVGERLQPFPAFPRLPAILVNPGVAVSTADVFSALGLKPGQGGASPLPGDALPRDPAAIIGALSSLRNDLQEPACALLGEITECLTILRDDPDVRLARMSGSGATCFALAGDERAARKIAARLKKARPDWWIVRAGIGNIDLTLR